MKTLEKFNLGVGLRTQHYPYLMQNACEVDFFEIISENYMDDFGYGRKVIEHLRKDTPFVMHGVSMSIGSTDPINYHYLDKLLELAEFVQPEWISDHLCWTGLATINTHDLLPLPLNKESLKHVTERVLKIQDYIKRPLVIENPSTYVEFVASDIKENDFLTQLCNNTNCELLLDVNNVFVSATNHNFDPKEYIYNLPHHAIKQVHLAGPTNYNNLLVDTHDQPVPTKVWELYQIVHQLTGGVSTLLEWDANIPDYPDLVREINLAKEVINGKIPNTSIYNTLNGINSNPVTSEYLEIK
ncbi:MNIO family bufferin maturase [Myroides guanonis]|uniref:Uncharacterized protein n=1 Tax=Myroides guanonis TaxID=1150112 RepID=A0A1I3LLH7_9FLAO|nr:DUF692 domain-containing protein [Myroides guanonis]SFI85563.1 hypothetical protein SAMN04487893_101383 [Myroides guanonis]